MSYPPEPNNPYANNPYGQQPQPPQGAPGYGYPQQQAPAPGFGAPAGYGIPPQQGGPHGGAPMPSPYASWGSRLAASLVDVLVLVPGYLVAAVGAFALAPSCTSDPDTGLQSCSGGSIGGMIAVSAIGYLCILGFALWQLYKLGTTGQTIGKKALNIRLVRETTGQPVGMGIAFLRQLLHGLDTAMCCIGFLWPLWDAKRQTIADKLMNTVVIKSQ